MYSLKLEMEGVSSAMVSAGPKSVPTLPEPLVLRLQNGNENTAVPAAQGAGKATLGCDSNVWAVLEGSGAKEVMVGYGAFFCG